MPSDVWPLIHAERQALLDDLSNLTAAQWATPSLCEGWSVLQVLGHQVATVKTNPGRFLVRMAAAGFSFTTFADRAVAAETAAGPAATLASLREHLGDTSAPPGPKATWIGEALVHGEDIRRPLGIQRSYPADAVRRALSFYTGSNVLIGTKKRIEGLQLRATDLDWTHGVGPLVEGPVMSLMLAGTGRKAALDDLTGPGVEILRGR